MHLCERRYVPRRNEGGPGYASGMKILLVFYRIELFIAYISPWTVIDVLDDKAADTASISQSRDQRLLTHEAYAGST